MTTHAFTVTHYAFPVAPALRLVLQVAAPARVACFVPPPTAAPPPAAVCGRLPRPPTPKIIQAPRFYRVPTHIIKPAKRENRTTRPVGRRRCGGAPNGPDSAQRPLRSGFPASLPHQASAPGRHRRGPPARFLPLRSGSVPSLCSVPLGGIASLIPSVLAAFCPYNA